MANEQKLLFIHIILFMVNFTILYFTLGLDSKANQLAVNTALNGESVKDLKILVESRKDGGGVKPQKYDLSHLVQPTLITYGPIQDDEALFLYSLVNMLKPKTVIEFGFFNGDSSFTLLKPLDPDAKFYSMDVTLRNPNAASLKDPRMKFLQKSQTDFVPADVENRKIDLAYLDAGHTLDIEVKLFPRLIPQMSETGIIVVHDTALQIYADKNAGAKVGPCICEPWGLCGFSHSKGEREFVNWIIDNYPEWQIVNVHSPNTYRNGLTVLQKKYKFSVTNVDSSKCRYI